MNTIKETEIQQAKRKGFWIIAVSTIIIVCLLVALHNFGFGEQEINEILSRTSWLYLFYSLVAMGFAFLFMGIRWASILPCKQSPNQAELAAMICAGLLLNYAAPGPVGEFGTAWFAHRRYRIPYLDALASCVSARLIGLLTACLMGSAVWLIFTIPIEEEYRSLLDISVLTTALGGLLIFYLAFNPIQSKATVGWLKRKINVPEKILDIIQKIIESVERISAQGSQIFIFSAFWSMCAHVSVIIGIVLAATALGTSYSIVGLVFTYTITTAAAAMLFALPGSYIGWDALFFGLLVNTAEIPLPEAMAIAIIIRLQQFLFMLLGGISLGWLLKTTK